MLFMLMDCRLQLPDLERSDIRRRNILFVIVEQAGAILQFLKVLCELLSE